MNPLNQVTIAEKSTIYDINLNYHSDKMCENYDAKILGVEEANGRITLRPHDGDWSGFVFDHSDPDRVIAIAQMMLSFAQMVKNNNKKAIDTTTNE